MKLIRKSIQMKLIGSVLVVVSLQAALLVLLPQTVVADGECGKARCGMGTCGESGNDVFGFACRCNPGWSRFRLGDAEFPFLPCVIPNCTINDSCQDGSPVPSLPPPPPPPAVPALTNLSVFDPCLLQYCGGGSCEKAASSGFAHRCACRDGFRNLLDDDTFPCYRQCSLGTDCAGLGIGVLNPSTSPPAPVSFTIQKNGVAGGRRQELLIMASFFWVLQAAW